MQALAKGHIFGWARGNTFGVALQPTDANVILYNFGSGNWCGMGTDPNGVFWVRTGLSGSPSAAFISDASQVCSFQGVPQAPTPPNGANDTRLATTAFVVANQPMGGPYLPLSGGTITGALT